MKFPTCLTGDKLTEVFSGKRENPFLQTPYRQNDEMHRDNMGGALPENNYREYQSDNSEYFNKSFIKDQNTLPEGKDYQTSANRRCHLTGTKK